MSLLPIRRGGLSLVEVLVVIAIIAVLIGLILPAIHNVRQAAIKTQSANQLRQFALALNNYAAARNGELPGVESATAFRWGDTHDNSPVYSVLPYITGEQDASFLRAGPNRPPTWHWRPIFLSPADPSVSALDPTRHTPLTPSSYSANMVAFSGLPRLPQSIPDGTSATLAYAERYCQLPVPDANWIYDAAETKPPLLPNIIGGPRRATFADAGWGDVLPVTAGDPPVTRASVPGVTFQHRPKFEHADPHQLQALHPSGLLVAMFDGGVRTLSPSIQEAVFWALVTRAGGEVVSDY